MRITICGSNAFHDLMIENKNKLEALGHVVQFPPAEWPDKDGKMISTKEFHAIRHRATKDDLWVWNRKKEAMLHHFDKVAWCEAVLILNYDKNEIKNYVGANTLMEMGLALYLKKVIYLLNPAPEMSYAEEILGMKPIILDGDLRKII